ncbi:complex I subunit 5 family protein [Alkaliphilus peptidifermentans]|uniref:Formate hydrogenlyase subunit 3/Multisubunit Na+/H+ antiporter, MnhD subunit n=1 Tax=Alkaliphilus peptidifermentans DSM 18978 TaxID=1120976 RepID=A0A1G5GDE4_9FIRM|nr:complex I subunit 5 family protein [Alkaliphilus peptidifermentans]SCY49583.1 Formate hydrogenlyase subunit 3/Multisubunit Na+/H+ antiporter, MnhD subunit [Alkaliphilus peptidifermentans DSM 18978]
MKSVENLKVLSKGGSAISLQENKWNSFSVDCIVVFIASLVIIMGFIALTITGLGDTIFSIKFEALRKIITSIANYKPLPLLVIMTPFLGSLVELYWGRKSDDLRDVTVVNTTFLSLLMILAMYPQALDGGHVYRISRILGFGLSFKVDMLSITMAFTTSVLWLLVMIYSHDYMLFENHRNRFYFFMSVTYGAILGTVMAGDIFTMFLFFEIMTFSSYMLVSHCEHEDCIVAGYNYIYMGVLGGLSILLGMILLYIKTGTLEFVPMVSMLEGTGPLKYWIIGLFIFGFGIKAGMAPVHIWLPKAHPVAPTPASALLSGIMIKIGAYGILRATTTIFFPAAFEISGYKDLLWEPSQNLGAFIIWLGIITMGLGVFLALQQANIKKMLAYHSISQMGYIVMGIGVAVYLGYKGGMGFSGALYHIINHALFKSLLFMVAGIIYLKTHELDMYKLGGLWKKMPFTAMVCLIAALGITGMPGFNGFASKSILHHAIIEAYEYGHPSFKYAEVIFTIISAGTVCSFIKLFGFVFLGKLPEKHRNIKGTYRMMEMAMAGMALMIIGIGLKPNYLLDHFIIPAVRSVTYDPAFIDKYLVNMNFFNGQDMMGMVWVYLLGAIIFVLGLKFHLFHIHLPEWLKIEYIFFYPLIKVLQAIRRVMVNGEEDIVIGNNAAGRINKALHAITEDRDESTMNKEGIIQRFVSTVQIFTNKYEMTIIRSDVIIYSVVLTGVMALLFVFR